MQNSDNMDYKRREPDYLTPPVIAPPTWKVKDVLSLEDEKVCSLIDTAIESYKGTWNEGAMAEHSVYYKNIHRQLDYARQRCEEMDEKIEALCALNVGKEVTPEIRKIEKQRRPFAIIVHSVAAQFMTMDAYLDHMRPLVEKELQQNIQALAERCGVEKLDLEKLDVTCTYNKQNNLILSFLEKPEKGFNAQLLMTKGSSIQRVPHARCVVSERKHVLSEQVMTEHVVDTMQDKQKKAFDERVTDALELLLDDCKEVYLKAHEDYFHLFQKKYPFIKKRYDELVAERAILNRRQAPRAKMLEKLISSMGKIANAKVAHYKMVSTYLDNCRRTWEEKLKVCMVRLKEKLKEKGFDVDSAKMKAVEMKENVVAFTLKDSLGNEADSRLILPVGNGIQAAPYLRIRMDEVRMTEKMQRSMLARAKLMSLNQVKEDNKPRLSMGDIPAGLVTQPKISEYCGKMFVICHVAGIRQSPKHIMSDEWHKYISKPNSDKAELALVHFQEEVKKALSDKGLYNTDEKIEQKR